MKRSVGWTDPLNTHTHTHRAWSSRVCVKKCSTVQIKFSKIQLTSPPDKATMEPIRTKFKHQKRPTQASIDGFISIQKQCTNALILCINGIWAIYRPMHIAHHLQWIVNINESIYSTSVYSSISKIGHLTLIRIFF